MKNIALFLKSAASIYMATIFYNMRYNPDTVSNPSSIMIATLSGLVGGFALYGVICFIAALRLGKTTEGFQREVKRNIDGALNPQKNNVVDK